jgi:hypothetical protein
MEHQSSSPGALARSLLPGNFARILIELKISHANAFIINNYNFFQDFPFHQLLADATT